MTAEQRHFARTSVFMQGVGWSEGGSNLLDISVYDVSMGGLRVRTLGMPEGEVFIVLFNEANDVLRCKVSRQSRVCRDVYELGLEIEAVLPLGQVKWPMEVMDDSAISASELPVPANRES